jgi:hypothetical protein
VKPEMKWNFITCRHDELKHGEMLVNDEEGGWRGEGGIWVKQPRLVPDYSPPPPLTVPARTYGML